MAENNNLDFLQSEVWRKFQESVGRKTFHLESDGFWANIIEHKLPVVGKYFYVPRGPVIATSDKRQATSGLNEIIDLAKKENAGWVRFDPNDQGMLDLIKSNIKYKITKAPHDMQPKEIFVMDITEPEEQLLAEMKAKTRYNINLAKKKGVKIFNFQFSNPNDQNASKKYINEFIKLVELTEKRKGISFHPANYYRKMFEIIPKENIKLYLAEYKEKIIAANLMIFYGDTAIYLHGATDDEYRNVMAPYLLQWQAILDAKKAGYEKYDFGGVKISDMRHATCDKGNTWQGITKFKLGFSPNTQPVVFPGSYDIIINSFIYRLYRCVQFVKSVVK